MSHDHPAAGDPSYAGFRIRQLWAWTQVDVDDQEGIIGMLGPDRTWMPLIASDQVRLDDLRPYAERVARETGRPVRLRTFAATDEGKVWEP